MEGEIVLRSLGELAAVRGRFADGGEPVPLGRGAREAPGGEAEAGELAALLGRLASELHGAAGRAQRLSGRAPGEESLRRAGPRPVPGTGAEAAARRERERAAGTALREARRLHRRDPAAAIARLEPLAPGELPPALGRHLYGCWLAACRRLGLLAAVHYRAAPLRGAVLIPAPDGRWEVVSALGLRRWTRGRRFAPQALRGARPLA